MPLGKAITLDEINELLIPIKVDYSNRPRPQHEIIADELFSRGLKCCARCNETQPIAEFTKNRNTKHGLKVYCKTCCKIEREIKRDYNKQKSKEWREANPDRFKERRDAWMQENPQSQNETRQQWLKANSLKVRQIKKAYKVRRQGWEIGEVDYVEILMRDGLVCHICGFDVEPTDIHFDHVIPLSKGGAHSMDNIHISHSRCNMKKHNKLMSELSMQKVTPTIKSG